MKKLRLSAFIFFLAILSTHATQITSSGGKGRVVAMRVPTDEYGKFYVSLKNDDTSPPYEFYFDYSSGVTHRYLTVLLTALGDRTDVIITAVSGAIESVETELFQPQYAP